MSSATLLETDLYNVYATHLLSEHDDGSGKGGATAARDGEAFGQASDVGATLNDLLLLGKLDVGVVLDSQVSCIGEQYSQGHEPHGVQCFGSSSWKSMHL